MKFDNIIKNKELVIFDLDGTIAKLNIDWPECRKEAKEFVEENFDIKLPDGLKVEEIEYIVVNKIGEEALKKLIKVREKFESVDLSESKLNNDVIKLIDSLRNNNLKLAIFSNNLGKTVGKFLKVFNMNNKFDYYVGLGDVQRPKPSTESCQKILDYFGLKKEKILIIGDNPKTDGGVAKKLNIDYLDVSELE